MARTANILYRTLVLAVLVTGAALLTAGTAAADTTFAAAENRFAAKLNAERAADGLNRLTVSLQLTRVARGWSATMADNDRMEHNPRLAEQVEGNWTRLGENVGYSHGPGVDPAELVDRLHQAFMDSAPHRANVLGDFNQVGVGVRITSGGTMWVTVNFSKDRTVVRNGTVKEAVEVAGRVFAPAGRDGRRAGYAVVTTSRRAAAGLAAAALAGDEGPLLFTHPARRFDRNPVLHPLTRAALDRTLGGRGLVYVVGGPGSVSDRAVRELTADGYRVKRLAGRSAATTSVAVARETVRRRGDSDKVVLAARRDWASSVSGAMWAADTGSPVLVTGRRRLHPAVRRYLDEARPARRWALGSSLTDGVVAAAGARRLGGAGRAATSVAVATRLWGRTASRNGDRWTVAPGYGEAAWAYTLAHAASAAAHDGPALLVSDRAVPAPVKRYLTRLDYGGPVKGRVEASSPVPRRVVSHSRNLVAG